MVRDTTFEEYEVIFEACFNRYERCANRFHRLSDERLDDDEFDNYCCCDGYLDF